jgi:hypothetical protein
MDEFKKCMNQACSIGGVHCDCCNPYQGKNKPKLNRIARRKLKQQTSNEIKHLGEDDETYIQN